MAYIVLVHHGCFPLEISFNVDLRAPKRQQRTISPENIKTCWTVKIKDGGDAVYIKNCFIGQFLKMTREFGSKRSRSANIVISTTY